jgi:hypothetical protein
MLLNHVLMAEALEFQLKEGDGIKMESMQISDTASIVVCKYAENYMVPISKATLLTSSRSADFRALHP